jgi:hypothetical protein
MEVIEDKLSSKQFGVAGIGNDHGYELKKIYLKDHENPTQAWVGELFPGAQIVRDIQEITSDNCIELVIVSASNSNDLSTLVEIIQTGKHVRVI